MNRLPEPPQLPNKACAAHSPDAESPPMTTHAIETDMGGRGGSRRLIGASVVAAVVGAAAIGAPAALGSADNGVAAPTDRAMTVATEVDLGAVTLDELGDELDELGLELRITPQSQLQSKLDDAFDDDDDSDVQPESTHDDDDPHHDEAHDHDEFADEEPLGAFPVDGDSIDLSSAETPEIAEQAQALWDRYVQLIPADQREMIAAFELVPEEFGGAYVYPTEEDPTQWVLGLGLGLGDDLDFVIVHEYAHLLSLQASQVPPSSDADGCETYFTGEGCAIDGSLMDEFVERFWSEEQQSTVRELFENEDWDGLDDFYSDNAEDFVTDYAITNPAEDFADTFATFVTEDEPDNLGSDDLTIAEQKIEWLWSLADMVELREEIRANR